MRAVFAQARAAGVAKAKKPLRGRGLGKAVLTIFGSYNERGAAIWSVLPIPKAVSIEQGRQPGKPPSTSALARNLGLGKVEGLTKEERVAVWAYFENVRRTGTQAFRYMAGVTETMQRDLPKWLKRAGDRIVRRLARAA